MTDVIARNNVKVFGKGERVLMLAHGFGTDQSMWRFVTPGLEWHYRIVLFDYVGSGGSDHTAYDPAKYATLQGYARDVLDVCEALDLKDAIFVGHSVSSMIGILAANAQPDRFSRLVLIAPSPRYLNDEDYVGGFRQEDIDALLRMMEEDQAGWAGYLAPNVMKNPDQPELSAELEASFSATDPAITRQFARTTFLADNRRDLSHVKLPTLILQSRDDMIVPISVGAYLHRQLPESTLVIMKATGHFPHMSQPEETISLIRGWIE